MKWLRPLLSISLLLALVTEPSIAAARTSTVIRNPGAPAYVVSLRGDALGGGVLMKRLGIGILALALWVAGSALGAVGGSTPAAATSGIIVGKAHAGYTHSLDLCSIVAGACTGSIQPVHAVDGGLNDGYIARLSPDLTQLRQLTYFGGNGEDIITSLAVNPTSARTIGFSPRGPE
jgi:hypothetical protein